MAKKNKINIENTGVDKLEIFMQNNIKTIIIAISLVVVLFIASYLIYVMYNISNNKKITNICDVENLIIDNESVDAYAKLSSSVSSLSNYVKIRSAEMYHSFGNDEKALVELKSINGDFAEISAGMRYDLGENIIPSNYLKGNMRELWYYRNVLSSDESNLDKNISEFKMLYPDSYLLKLVENWSVK